MRNWMEVSPKLIINSLLPSFIFIFLFSACSAGSMQIDVEVYKGPLSKPVEIQLAELRGYILDTKTALSKFLSVLTALKKEEKFKDFLEDNPEKEANFKSLENDISSLRSNFRDLNLFWLHSARHSDSLLLQKTAIAGQQLKSTAFYWSTYLTFTKFPKGIKKSLADYVNMASQFGNQLTSRTDALHKQLVADSNSRTTSRRNLPLGAYLRDTRPTDFISMYDWLDAADLGCFGSCEIEERVNVFSHLFDDNFWSNINTVYATGMGDTNMAFAKDEIGNWTLRSFGSDPTKMVDAYANLTLAGLKAASDTLLKGAGVDPELIETISKLTSGQLGSGVGLKKQSKMKELRKEALDELEDLKTEQGKQKIIEEAKKVLKKYREKLDMLESL